MSGKIGNMIRENIFILSILTTIVGLIVLVPGLAMTFNIEFLTDALRLSTLLDWGLYVLVVGFIVLLTGVWYLYTFLKNKKFLLTEIETNKRSEFMKRHGELQDAARHLPSKYRDMLSEKEKNLKIK
jgi:thiol:disulfide interchange protein